MSRAAWLRNRVPPSIYTPLARAAKAGLALWYSDDLGKLARVFDTDKWGTHWYTQHYQRYFGPIRHAHLNLLEIGVGGYRDSRFGGESLRMWKAFFPNSRIVGIDIEDKTHLRQKRIDIRQCDQTDAEALTKLSSEYGGFDIIIDDGSHLNQHVIATFHVLFPLLRDGGFYAIEDVQTSYWPGWGGGLRDPRSSMEFFKGLADGVNYMEYPIDGYAPTYFDRNIVEIAFFHNLILIRKSRNDEKASAPGLLAREIAAKAAAL